ncbi:MAG: hypothetical protein ABI772_02240 [Bacteroidota bacterium]
MKTYTNDHSLDYLFAQPIYTGVKISSKNKWKKKVLLTLIAIDILLFILFQSTL